MNATASLSAAPAGKPNPATNGHLDSPAHLLHGAFAMPDQRRGYTVVDVQHGVITAMDDDTTTVTSPDGFTRSYLVGVRDRDLAGAHRGVPITIGCRVWVSAQDGAHQILEVSAPAPDATDHAPEADALPAAEP